MESKQENRGLNLVIVHKETRWKKMKGRISSWFRSEKPVVDPVVVPEIIVTSPEDNTGITDSNNILIMIVIIADVRDHGSINSRCK